MSKITTKIKYFKNNNNQPIELEKHRKCGRL